MTTSLPDDSALFHLTAKVFQRSAGRSSVAAAAYRSASKLTDDRTGESFDYTQKRIVESFILAPENAPEWTQDRAALWNRAEFAEKRRDAVVAREIEISIPRDIPPERWRAFAEEVCKPYIEAGAIADIATHCPADVYGNPQPHLHIMLATRALDAATETGFASKKNSALTSIFESGGRNGGGKKGDALVAERERVAGLMNNFLAAAGSQRRASHQSYADQGLDREPEPKVGESRKHGSRRRGKGDRLTQLVGSIRAAKIIENELIKAQEELMAINPKFQSQNGIKPRHKQDFKAKLLADRIPDLPIDAACSGKLHMIDVRHKDMTKIQTRDGGWIEIKGRSITTYGQRGYADDLAAEIAAAIGADEINRLEEMHSIQRKNSGIKARRRADDPIPQLPAADVESRADKWRSRGFTDITEASDGTWIHIGACRLQDLGDEVRIHGKPSDAASRALLMKAVDEWNSEIEIFGDKAFKDSVWLQAQRQGVTVFDRDTGALYEPSPDVRRAFEADLARNNANVVDLEGVRNHKAIASLVRGAAAGEEEALSKLEKHDRDLADYLTVYLDDEQRARLASKSEADIVAALPDFRDDGRKARELDDEQRKGDHGPFGAQPNDRDDGSSLAEYNARIEEEERFSRDMETRRPK